MLRIINLLSDRQDLTVCMRPHGSGEVFLDATLAFYGLDGGLLPPGKMTGYQRIKTPHLDIGLSGSGSCAAPVVEFDVELQEHPFQTLVLAGELAPQGGGVGAAEGWQLLKDRPEAPKSGEFFGRGVHAIAGTLDLEIVSWIQGTLDSKTFRGMSFRKQPVGIARIDPFFTIDDLGYAKVTVSIDALSQFEVLAPAHSRRLGLFAPTQEQRDRLKEPGDGTAPPVFSFFAWGKVVSQIVDGYEELGGISATGCFEDYQIRKGLSDCYDVATSTALPIAPLRLGNLSPRPVRACVKPTTYKSWKIVPSNGYLIEPFQILRDLPTPADIYETAFIDEDSDCASVEAGKFAPLPMNIEWAKLPETKKMRPVTCFFVNGGEGSARLLMDVIPPSADYAAVRLGDLLAGAGALAVGIDGLPPIVEESPGKQGLSKKEGAAKFDGVSNYALINEAKQAHLLVREVSSGIALRAALPVDLAKGGVSSIWLSGDWARRDQPEAEDRPRLVVCDDLAAAGPAFSCSAPIDLEQVP